MPPHSTVESTAEAVEAVLMAVKEKGHSGRPHVLILCSETGGGHFAAALGLRDGLHAVLGEGCVRISIVDIWSECAMWPFKTLVPTYRFMAANPWLWGLFYYLTSLSFVMWILEIWSAWACAANFRNFFEQQRPDVVVSVHPMCQHVPLLALNQLGGGRRTVPFVAVVTDLGACHPVWFHPEIDLLLAPSAAVRNLALSHGMAEERVRVTGMPVRAAFWRAPTDKAAVRKSLGLAPLLPVVLVVGGAEGVGGISRIAAAMAKRLAQDLPGGSQLLVVCGKNAAAKQRLEKEVANWPANVNVRVLGYANNMDVLMAAATCIVTKAGTSTVCEAMSQRLPIMLSSHLPGQESGNVTHVLDGGFGAYCTDPEGMAAVVGGWLSSEKALRAMRRAAAAAARGNAACKAASEIVALLPPPKKAPLQSFGLVGGLAAAPALKVSRGALAG